ncbi:MAG: DUF4397 domain-containing protein [Bacteroidota bacterium]
MKNKFFNLTTLAAVALVVASAFSSCKKDDDIDPSGSANVKIVNASTGSTAQGFYLASKTVVQGGLTFGNASSSYIAVNSGTNLQMQFRNDGSSAAYASGSYDFDNGGYYTVFLAGDGQTARVQVYKDDLAAPSNGKAKVKFVHLSDAAAANVDIRKSSGDNLAVNLARNSSSNYVELEPGVLSLQVFATGQSTSLGNFDLTAFAAGKIYTVYITGSTTATVSVRQVVHN